MTLGQNVPKLDALHLMDGIEGLRSLPKHSVDMLLTDPPYGTTRNFWDLPLPELWEAVRWAVKPNGAILFFAQCPFDKMLGASNLAMLRYEWVWYKSRATGFLNANSAPLKKSENILVFYQKSPVYHPQFTYGEPYRKTNPRSGCSTNYGKFERTGSESSDGRRYPGNVLFVPTVTGGIHPTQKPVELCEYFIKTYTDEGEVVADICAGSGTTAVAAMNTGRRFICFENAPSIYTIAAQRLDGVAQVLRLAAGTTLRLFAPVTLVAGARQQHLTARLRLLPSVQLLPVQALFLLQRRQRSVQRLIRSVGMQNAGVQPQRGIAAPDGHGVEIEGWARPAGVVIGALLAGR